MIQATFSGTFLKPVESFVVQKFDFVDLNRLTPEVLFWVIGVTVLVLLAHSIVEALVAKKGRGGK